VSVVASRKDQEVQFYLDRSKESVITILKSIVDNPRLSDSEQFQAMHTLASHHFAIAQLIQEKLNNGEQRGYDLAALYFQSLDDR